MTMREGMGFGNLSQQEQHAYRILLKSFSALTTVIDSSQIDRNVDLMKVIQTVLGDNPSIIYFNKTQIKTVALMFNKRLQLTGCPGKSQINRMDAELESKANTIVATIRGNANNEYEQLIGIHDYLQQNIRYDGQELLACSSGRSKNQNSHNAYGSLISGLAVCDGISSAFSLLAQKLGHDCMVVGGRSTYRSTGTVEHAWNIVKVNNKYYHIDVTWDLNQRSEFKELSYDYFGLDDEEIINDHDWDIRTTPACSSSNLSFYRNNGLFANNMEQAQNIVRLHIRKNQPIIRFKLSYNIALPTNVDRFLGQLVVDTIVKAGKSAQINYWWNEHTRCFLAKYY